jgi:DNA-binding MarR family transcriptional regulator
MCQGRDEVPFDSEQKARMLELRQQHVGRLLQEVSRRYNQEAVTRLRQRGHPDVTRAHLHVLTNLDPEGTRISVLAERAAITKQSMGQLVLELEQRGYVTRTADQSDRRATLVLFAEQGWRFLFDAAEVWADLEAGYRVVLGADGLAQLRQALRALRAYADQREGRPAQGGPAPGRVRSGASARRWGD